MPLICPECKIELSTIKAGVLVVETYRNPPVPYRLWNADLMECRSCGKKIVGRFANNEFWHSGRNADGIAIKAISESPKHNLNVIYWHEKPQSPQA